MDSGTLVWNGNGVTGKDNIQKFWTDLPDSDHSVTTLDAQPITGIKELFFFSVILRKCNFSHKV